MFERTYTYTFDEYFQKLEEDKNKKLEAELRKAAFKNKFDVAKKTAVSIATTIFLTNHPSIAFAASSDSLWELGTLFLGIAQKLGYFIILTCAIVEIIKMAPTGADKEDILKVLIKYVLLFASLFLLPNVFNLIAEKLGGGIAW